MMAVAAAAGKAPLVPRQMVMVGMDRHLQLVAQV
jgi:hypothetical protein